LACACGFVGFPTKAEAKRFLRDKFQWKQVAPDDAHKAKRVAHAAKVKALEEKLNNPAPPQVATDAFLDSFEWRRVRMVAIKKYGARCQCCGATPSTGATINVDHIKPRKLFPQLALDMDNLQVLCHECNHGKGNWDMTDWRESTLA
jgi:5-methylcytosine-specific restriction endonuclease McrA